MRERMRPNPSDSMLRILPFLLTIPFLLVAAQVASAESEMIEVGVAWQGQASMPARVLVGIQKALSEGAPQIQLDIRSELKDESALAAVVTEFENSKDAMVILRSSGAVLLSQRQLKIPTFVGAINNPKELGVATSLKKPQANVTGVTYYIPAQLKLETFQQVYPPMREHLLLVEKNHPSSSIDAKETAAVAPTLGLIGRSIYCRSLEEALMEVQEADRDVVIILGSQALLIDNTAAIVEAAGNRPVFSYSEKPVESGALAGLVADDEKLGSMLAMMIIEVLVNEKPIADMPIQTDPEPRLRLNPKAIEQFKERIPFAIQSLVATEEVLTRILESVPTGIGVMEDNIIVQVNDYILNLLGYRQEELIGMSSQILYPTYEEYEYVALEKSQQLANLGFGFVETQWLSKNGSIRHVALSSKPLDKNDLSLGVIFTALDITDKKEAEAALFVRTRWFILGLTGFILLLLLLVSQLIVMMEKRKSAVSSLKESEKKLRALFGAMTEMVVLHDVVLNQEGDPVDYRITDCNHTYTAITGIKRDAAIGRLASEVYEAEPPPYLEEFCQVGLTGEPYHFETYYAPMDKHLSISVVSPDRNKFATITTDITAIKEIQHAIAAKNKELEQIVYVTSHDLRSPLVNVDGYSRELEYSIEDLRAALDEFPVNHCSKKIEALLPDMMDSLQHIRSSARQMDTLLKGLLKLSRSGRASLSIALLDMNRLVADVVSAMEYQIKERGARLTLGPLPACRGDEAQVTHVFSNLVNNSLKFLDPKRPGQITIRGAMEQGQIVYCVEDNGIGIDLEHQKNIFELFHRLNPKETEGDGLGLTIAQQILERLDGKIWVESCIGQGSKFYVALPSP